MPGVWDDCLDPLLTLCEECCDADPERRPEFTEVYKIVKEINDTYQRRHADRPSQSPNQVAKCTVEKLNRLAKVEVQPSAFEAVASLTPSTPVMTPLHKKYPMPENWRKLLTGLAHGLNRAKGDYAKCVRSLCIAHRKDEGLMPNVWTFLLTNATASEEVKQTAAWKKYIAELPRTSLHQNSETEAMGSLDDFSSGEASSVLFFDVDAERCHCLSASAVCSEPLTVTKKRYFDDADRTNGHESKHK